jgi:hypothetical protein
MSNPRPLGNKARQIVDDADWQLAAAFRKAELLAGNEIMERIERQLYAEQIKTFVAEARRLLADVSALRDA